MYMYWMNFLDLSYGISWTALITYYAYTRTSTGNCVTCILNPLQFIHCTLGLTSTPDLTKSQTSSNWNSLRNVRNDLLRGKSLLAKVPLSGMRDIHMHTRTYVCQYAYIGFTDIIIDKMHHRRLLEKVGQVKARSKVPAWDTCTSEAVYC